MLLYCVSILGAALTAAGVIVFFILVGAYYLNLIKRRTLK